MCGSSSLLIQRSNPHPAAIAIHLVGSALDHTSYHRALYYITYSRHKTTVIRQITTEVGPKKFRKETPGSKTARHGTVPVQQYTV
jgi:hypothetical protein